MDLINMKYICTQVEFPCCRIFEDSNIKYAARYETIGNFRIYNPSTFILLLSIVVCTLRMIGNVKVSYTSVGRKEMKVFFYIYLCATLMELLNVTHILDFFGKPISQYYIALQLAVASTAVNSLTISSAMTGVTLFDHRIVGEFLTKSICLMLFFINVVVITFGITTKNTILIFFYVLVGNFCWLFLYVVKQLKKLIREDLEIWAYGTLSIAFSFFILAIIPIFTGASLIAWLTDRYLDSLFFFHLFSFCSIVMVHKFWLSISEGEKECVFLEVESNKVPVHIKSMNNKKGRNLKQITLEIEKLVK